MESIYTLSWEEYSELFSDSWPRPDYFSAIVVAMVSIPLIAYGVILAVFGMPDEHTINWMFIGGPAFLLLAAFLSIASGSKKAIKEAKAEKRAQYERWHAKEQTFSFDQEKWTLRSASGKWEIPWSGILAAVEWPNVFLLLFAGGQAIVPKRAINAEMIGSLRTFASLEPREIWPYKISVWDYQAAETVRFWKRYWFRMAFGNVFGVVVLVWLFQIWQESNEKIGIVWGWVIAAFVLVLTLSAQIWYVPLKYWTSRERLRAPKGVAISSWGLCFGEHGIRSFLGWKQLQSFEEIKRAFLVYTSKDNYHLFSKRYFSSEQIEELRNRLQRNVPRKSEEQKKADIF